MNVQEIIDLIDFISKKKFDEIKLETDQIKLSIKKTAGGSRVVEQQYYTPAPTPIALPAPVAAPVAAQPAVATQTAAEPAANDSKYITIKSPMVGTFYRSANPESAAFAEVGDKISAGQPVCIIEAMKLFNEIESEISGTIVKVLVENATPVEYDQPLFLVDPA